MKKPLNNLTTEQIEKKIEKSNKTMSRLTPIVFYGFLFLFLGIAGLVYGHIANNILFQIISGVVTGVSGVNVFGGFGALCGLSYKEDTLEEELKKRKLEEGLSKLTIEKVPAKQIESKKETSPAITTSQERIIPKMSVVSNETKVD